MPKVNDQQRNAALQMLLDGRSRPEVVEATGITYNQVAYISRWKGRIRDDLIAKGIRVEGLRSEALLATDAPPTAAGELTAQPTAEAAAEPTTEPTAAPTQEQPPARAPPQLVEESDEDSETASVASDKTAVYNFADVLPLLQNHTVALADNISPPLPTYTPPPPPPSQPAPPAPPPPSITPAHDLPQEQHFERQKRDVLSKIRLYLAVPRFRERLTEVGFLTGTPAAYLSKLPAMSLLKLKEEHERLRLALGHRDVSKMGMTAVISAVTMAEPYSGYLGFDLTSHIKLSDALGQDPEFEAVLQEILIEQYHLWGSLASPYIRLAARLSLAATAVHNANIKLSAEQAQIATQQVPTEPPPADNIAPTTPKKPFSLAELAAMAQQSGI